MLTVHVSLLGSGVLDPTRKQLEAQDVIVLPNELTTRKPDAPLFPAFYKAHNKGAKPTLDDLAGMATPAPAPPHPRTRCGRRCGAHA